MQNLRRIRYIAENFDELLGLRSVLAGLIMLAALPAIVGTLNLGLIFLSVAVFVGLIALWPIVESYYERNFGRIRPALGKSHRRRTFGMSVALLYITLALVDILLHPTIILTGLGMAVALIISWWLERPFRVYYLVASVLITGVALLPLVGLLPDERSLQFTSAMVLAVTGLFLVLRGILDHLFLVRSMKSLPEESID